MLRDSEHNKLNDICLMSWKCWTYIHTYVRTYVGWEGHNSAWNSRATAAAPREKRKLRNTLEQELTYGVIRKFEDGVRCHLSLSAWPRMVTGRYAALFYFCAFNNIVHHAFVFLGFFCCRLQPHGFNYAQSFKSLDNISSCSKKQSINDRH